VFQPSQRSRACPAWIAWVFLISAGCDLPLIDETGKRCSRVRTCGDAWVCLNYSCQVPATSTGLPGTIAAVTLIDRGSMWRYFDSAATPGTGWESPEFDASTWPEGRALLGYPAGGDIVTPVEFGPDAANRRIAVYFRREFYVGPAQSIQNLSLGLRRDDGGVAYLNGTEVTRSNMPAGPIGSGTPSAAHTGSVDELTYFPFSLSVTSLRAGVNVVAVEVHQDRPDSSDLIFDLALTGDQKF
jgi:hypothetical protein